MYPARVKFSFRTLLCFLALVLSSCRFSGTSKDMDRRISDTPIIPGYIVTPAGMQAERDPSDLAKLKFSAAAGSYGYLGGQSAALRIAVFSVGEEWVSRVGTTGQGTEAIEGDFVGEITSEPDGSVKETALYLGENQGYLLLFVFDVAGGGASRPSAITAPDTTAITAPVSDVGVGYFSNLFPMKSLGLWTTSEELEPLNRNHVGFTYIVNRAKWQPHWAIFDLANSQMNSDSAILAAAVAYKADPKTYADYKRVVVDGIGTLMSKGQPTGNMNAFSSNIVGFVMAADLIGYRTAAFDNFLKNLSRVWTGNVAGQQRTMIGLWRVYANTASGMQALLALTTIYSYLGEKPLLQTVLNQWKQEVNGTSTLPLVWLNTPWQVNPDKKHFINPIGSVIQCDGRSVDISGSMPQFMARTNPCAGELVKGWDAWKSIEMMVSVARIAERQGYPIWSFGNHAIKRALKAMENYKVPVKAYPGLAWMLKFVDKRYGTSFSCALSELAPGFEWAGGVLGLSWIEGEVKRTCPK